MQVCVGVSNKQIWSRVSRQVAARTWDIKVGGNEYDGNTNKEDKCKHKHKQYFFVFRNNKMQTQQAHTNVFGDLLLTIFTTLCLKLTNMGFDKWMASQHSDQPAYASSISFEWINIWVN